MKNNKQSRAIAIIALCLSVVGITLGFAAFSNTLKISSSATVTPDPLDFKLVAYGLEDTSENFGDVIWYTESYTSSTSSKPYLGRGTVAEDAKIENSNKDGNNNIVISNLNPTLKSPGDAATYYFLIKNEGKYDAYLASENVTYSGSKVCEAVVKEGQSTATDALVQEACKDIFLSVQVTDMYNSQFISPESVGDADLLLTKYDADDEYASAAIVQVDIVYRPRSERRADGDFTVKLPDINMEFLTVPVIQ